MRKYEIAVVLHPDLEIDQENTTKKIEKIITNAGGEITNKDEWGKHKLAYKIQKQQWGIFTFYQVEIDPLKVRSINETLRITEEVMRYLIVSLENIRFLKKPDQKKAKKSVKPESRSKDKE